MTEERQTSQTSDESAKDSNQKKSKRFNQYIRYSGLGFQMIGAILLMAWLGSYIDGRAGTSKPVYTLICMLIGVTGSIYLLIRDLTRK